MRLGTLSRYAPEESTLDEYHPGGTNYWSSNAPVAPNITLTTRALFGNVLAAKGFTFVTMMTAPIMWRLEFAWSRPR